MIPRILISLINERLRIRAKTILLVGPRQTGKTTLIRELLKNVGDYLFINGDDPLMRDEMTHVSTEKLRRIIGTHRIIFIDEAQRIPDIGITLKLITDVFENCQLYVSGSSAFELQQGISEPLTGRKWEFNLYPISWNELQQHVGYLTAMQQLETRILFGMYPDVIGSIGNERAVLNELVSSYLYKDILALAGLRKPDVLEKLVKALALQVGHEVSYNELANLVGVDKNTVSAYIDLLEKAFVIFRLQPFSRNIRNEISTSRKIYFYDTGVRNAIIGNFNPLDLRTDTGALWENFLVAERVKRNAYMGAQIDRYFWRTKAQQEIDYIEESNGQLAAFEFKFANKKAKMPITFSKAYPGASFHVITRDNFFDFVV